MSDPLDIVAAVVLVLLLPTLLSRYYRFLKGDVSLSPPPWFEPPRDLGPVGSASILLLVFAAMFMLQALVPILLAGSAYFVAQLLVGNASIEGVSLSVVAAGAVGAPTMIWFTRSERHMGIVLMSAAIAWGFVQLSAGDVLVAGMTAPIVAAMVAALCCLLLMAWSATRARH